MHQGLVFSVVIAGCVATLTCKQPLIQEAEIVVRQEIHKLQPDSSTLVALRRGIAAMRELARDDRRNWFFIANLHDYPRNQFGHPIPSDPEDKKVPQAERDKFWRMCV